MPTNQNLLYRPKGFTPSCVIVARAAALADRHATSVDIKMPGTGLFSAIEPDSTSERLSDQAETIEAMRPREIFNPNNCITIYFGRGASSSERVRLAIGLASRSKMAVVIQGNRRGGRLVQVVVTRRSELDRKTSELISARR